MNLLQQVEREILTARKRETVDVRPGDTVRVHVRIVEGSKSRIQIFEGTCIRIKRGGPRTTFTVRKMASGVGVERIFPATCPNVERIEITARHKVRRAKLHFLRGRTGKAARLKPIRDFVPIVALAEETSKRKRRGKKRRQAARDA
ncbi:MAG: 50S ribosomal protein L19 [Deltaproteobacteria bacterium]|nr:MAG: 50S ribosomal protein L19 [Deltaproteobacteria bacterium]